MSDAEDRHFTARRSPVAGGFSARAFFGLRAMPWPACLLWTRSRGFFCRLFHFNHRGRFERHGAKLTRIHAELVREVVRDKVSAGLFALPQGIDAEELAGTDDREPPVTVPAAEAPTDTGGSVLEAPGPEGGRTTDPGRGSPLSCLGISAPRAP